MATKASVRATVLAARTAVRPGPRAAADSALVTHAMGTVVRLPARTVAAYVPLAGEPGGPALVDALRAVAGRVLLPVLRVDRDLDWAAYEGAASMASGPFGLREPAGDRLGVTAPASADLMIVPAVAVDRSGMRLGRGGGSYDRVLARLAGAGARLTCPLVVAMIYDGELVETVPADPHDRPVDAVITPSGGLFRFRRSVDQNTKAGREPG